MSDPNASLKPKHRSPTYPAFDLATAIQRTQQLWDHAQRHLVAMAAAMGVWDYRPKSSGGIQAIAALKRFGLLDDEGAGSGRQVRVSDLGREIVTDDPDSLERRERIQQAALLPKIHSELWDLHGTELPPDSTLRFYLVNNRAFSEKAAREVIDEVRKTWDFAGLADYSGSVSSGYQELDETVKTEQTLSPMPRDGGKPTSAISGFRLPVGPGKWATLEGDFPITEEQWNLMLRVLETMKPGLVSEPEE